MKSIAITYTPHLTRLSAIFAGVIALSALLYGIFLLEAVANTAKRASAEHQIAALTGKVSYLEAQYLTRTREITLESAQALGYVTLKSVTTVYANAAQHTLGYGGLGDTSHAQQ